MTKSVLLVRSRANKSAIAKTRSCNHSVASKSIGISVAQRQASGAFVVTNKIAYS